jgi:hypothetical protein
MANGVALKALLVVAILVVVGTADDEGTVPRTPNPHPRSGVAVVPSPTSSTNIPSGGLTSCAGQVAATESAPVGEDGGLALQVFFDEANGGRSCAMVTKTGSAQDERGELTVTLQRHNYDGQRWPRYAVHRHSGTDPRSAAIYLDETNDLCVRAEARFDPDSGRPVTLTTGKIGCRWSPPVADST